MHSKSSLILRVASKGTLSSWTGSVTSSMVVLSGIAIPAAVRSKIQATRR